MEHQSSSMHVPVMCETAVQMLDCHAGGLYVDGTVGGGGYAEAILRASEPDGRLVALDWDAEAISRVREGLSQYGSRLLLKKASFSELSRALAEFDLGPVDGIVIDLGVSSFQLDDPVRGFSFLRDGPLDMRMDQGLPRTAADLVNTLSEQELARIIFRLGEERWSRRIAHAIVSQRKREPIQRTVELAELISSVVPRTKDSRRIHPATRTFQALRMAVNEELEAIERFLSHVLDVLKPGGRLCVVAFHSLEDRMIKDRFREWGRSCRCAPDIMPCHCEGKPLVRLLTKRVLRPGHDEVEVNPRARSARMRAIEKLGG